MRRITYGITPNEYKLILEENFNELADIRSVSPYELIELSDDGITQCDLINTALGYNAVYVGQRGIGILGTAFYNEAGGLSMAVSDFQNASQSYIAGLHSSIWSYELGLTIPKDPLSQLTPYTVIERGHAVRQRGYIRSFTIPIYSTITESEWEFKIFEISGSNYLCKYSEKFYPVGDGVVSNTQTFTLHNPAKVNEGDIVGIYMPTKCSVNFGRDSNKYGVEPRQITTNIAIGESSSFTYNANPIPLEADWKNVGYLYIEANGDTPYLAILGDSIVGGGNGHEATNDGSEWLTDQESSTIALHTPGCVNGDINLSVAYRIQKNMFPSFRCQSFGKGGSTLTNIIATGYQLSRAVETNAKSVVIHCGINDILFATDAPHSWENISSNLDTIRNAFPSQTKFYLDEILPSSNKTDNVCKLIRETNINYADYCNTYGWTLVKCHDEMGIIKQTTGFYDDINPLYERGDSLHLSAAGVDKLAEIISRYIKLNL